MTRTRILIGLVAIAVLVGLAWWSVREPSPARTNAAPIEGDRSLDAPATSLDAPEDSVVRSIASSSETATAPLPAGGPRPIVIAGVVHDLEPGAEPPGRPAPRVRVACRALDTGKGMFGLGYADGSSNDGSLETQTDDAGRFRFEVPDPGKRPVKFHVSTLGDARFVQGSADVKLAESEFDATEIVLERHENSALTGVTVDVDGRPVPNVVLAFIAGERREDVTSDQEGQFVIAAPEWVEDLEITRDGYVLVEAKHPTPRDDGTFETMRVVLAPAAHVRLQVVDPRGAPRAGARARIELSAFEPFRHEHFLMGYFMPDLEGESDSNGIIEFDPVWARTRMSIAVRPSSESHAPRLVAERHMDGTLLFGDTYDGAPIAVGKGAEISLRAILPATFRIEGTVSDDTGALVPSGWISIRPDECDPSAAAFQPQMQQISDGRFALEFMAEARTCRVRVFAADGNGLIGPTDDSKHFTGEFALDVDKTLTTELVVAPTLAIRGRIVDADGNGVSGSITPYVTGPCALRAGIRSFQSKSKAAGEFTLPGLLPGRYDLLVRPSETYAEQWVRGIEAGRVDLEVRLDSPRTAKVTIEVIASDAETKNLIVLNGRIEPREGIRTEAPTLASTSEWKKLEGWPRGLGLGLWYGGGGSNEDVGHVAMSLTLMRENPKTIGLTEGDYWFGAKGKDREGRMLFPIGTGPVRVNAGEHTLRFELVPAVPIRGRVRHHDGRDLAVAIARADGTLLEFDFDTPKMTPIRELAGDGSFSFPIVPIGAHELRVGTPRELLEGRAQHRQSLTVTGRDDAELDIVLSN